MKIKCLKRDGVTKKGVEILNRESYIQKLQEAWDKGRKLGGIRYAKTLVGYVETKLLKSGDYLVEGVHINTKGLPIIL